ncbi:capsule biosynthesis protein [Mangrovicoccus sp. HB161399]|uniref:capsule biosynthesis protein n=1 Tax=Mangrovicoccus sp. HB161399 TaxID=2720392 RepID=UPI00155511EB|nr:capsule biosynthesis protein [Mangrovicoccus sp. HB161399]
MTTKPQSDDPGATRRRARLERRKARAEKIRARQEEHRADVQAEGFTGHQLRNAMRLARHHGLSASDPFEAVRLLRERGVDPQSPANPLHLVVDNTRPSPDAMPVPVIAGMSPAQIADEQRQLLEIERIQQDILRRRKRNVSQLWARIAGFVIVPTLAAWLYFAVVATPMYSTKAEFIVQKSSGGGSGLSSLLAGTTFGSSQEAVAVQRYIDSKEAMVRLSEEQGFIGHFSDSRIDPLARLPANASIERAYRLYKRRVKAGYDPSEGVVQLEVSAADPAVSVAFADALVSYAEQVVNDLTLRQRRDQLAGAERAFSAAEADVQAAQRKVLALEEARGVISAEAEIGAVMSQIAALEMLLQQERLELAGLLDNPAPNKVRVAATQAGISRLRNAISGLRGQLTNSEEELSLAQVNSDLHVAKAGLATREAMLQEALQALQAARREADRQVGYLSLNVSPVAPEQAAYPRVAANTAMAFLIFAGIYLMVSLTASVLKEQVTN